MDTAANAGGRAALVEAIAMGYFLRNITARNVLSFGPSGMSLDLRPLNVLIGANGSGKSNLLEVISLLQAAPRELAAPVRAGGGIGDWIWQGQPDAVATVAAVVASPDGEPPIKHTLSFTNSGQSFRLTDERVAKQRPGGGPDDDDLLYQFQAGRPTLKSGGKPDVGIPKDAAIAGDASILSQAKDPARFPEFAHLSKMYGRIRLYRELEFGRNAAARQPQSSDAPPGPLAEDFSNLGMFLNKLRQHPSHQAALFEKLRDIYDGITDFELNVKGNTVQLSFTEGEFAMPASRLSDGSLRYLCLLAILLDPDPPPLIAIEEPELGIHPDLLHKLADLLVDASRRTQLIVTTHSDIMLDSLSAHPESVVVCEKHKGQTEMRRLDHGELAYWLEKYEGLGDLWNRGYLGGVRW